MSPNMEFSDKIKLVQKESGYVVAYDFEVYDILKTLSLLRNNRWILFTTVVVYLAAVYLGQKWMKNRQAYKLTKTLLFWNFGLAIFSGICTSRGMPEVLHHLSLPGGTYSAGCVALPHNYATSFWGFLLLLSKFAELGDTAFIILRKQKLIPLHWFHHVATLVVCWFGFEYYVWGGRLFFINSFVHTFMYSYYALKAFKIKFPKSVSQAMTTLQILQLMFGIYAFIVISYNVAQSRPCDIHADTFAICGVVNAIVLGLFIQFYKKSYLERRVSNKQAQISQ